MPKCFEVNASKVKHDHSLCNDWFSYLLPFRLGHAVKVREGDHPNLTSNNSVCRAASGKARGSVTNIARIVKHCPQNITSVVKCVKLFFPKVLRKKTFFGFIFV